MGGVKSKNALESIRDKINSTDIMYLPKRFTNNKLSINEGISSIVDDLDHTIHFDYMDQSNIKQLENINSQIENGKKEDKWINVLVNKPADRAKTIELELNLVHRLVAQSKYDKKLLQDLKLHFDG